MWQARVAPGMGQPIEHREEQWKLLLRYVLVIRWTATARYTGKTPVFITLFLTIMKQLGTKTGALQFLRQISFLFFHSLEAPFYH
jgi:hypothetical protein